MKKNNIDFSITFESEEQEKEYLLDKIKHKLMGIAAYNLKIEAKLYLQPRREKVEEWKDHFLKWPLATFKQNLLPYFMSESFTSYIYILEQTSMNKIRDLLKDKDKFRNYSAFMTDLAPEFYFYSDKAAILVKIALKKKYELVREHGKMTVRAFVPFDDIWIVFHSELGVLEVRTNKPNQARSIINRIKQGLGINCTSLRFSFEEIKAFFKWLTGISNSHFRFESGALSSAQFTSALKENGTRDSLLGTKPFAEAMESGKIVSIYGYIPFSYIFPEYVENDTETSISAEGSNGKEEEEEEEEVSMETSGKVSFSVNFIEGKIYFSTALSEIEVSNLIKEIIRQVDIEMHRKIEKPSRQTRFNPLDFSQTY